MSRLGATEMEETDPAQSLLAPAMAHGWSLGEVQVTRPALTVSQRSCLYHRRTGQRPDLRKRMSKYARASLQCSRGCVKAAVEARLPIVAWLPKYHFRHALLADVIAGVTVGVMQIPQGMAYALLAALPPITGMYMAFFPVLMYVLLGTSRHVSMGPLAIASLMMQGVVTELSTEGSSPTLSPDTPNATVLHILNSSFHHVAPSPTTYDHATAAIQYSPQQVAAVLSLMVGIWMVGLGLFQLGQVFSVLLSSMLVSAFTTAVAVQVLTSQLKHLLGIPLPRYSGLLKVLYMYYNLCLNLPSTNLVVLGVSVACILVLVVNNEVLKPRLKKITRIPLPMELVVVIAFTVFSYLLDLEHRHQVNVVGHIPTGVPAPSLPPVELASQVLVDGFLIAVVTYTSSFSMGKIFAQKHGYTVDAKQELYALGFSNVFGSFFSCGPTAASLSRSMIHETVGGVTLLTSFFSCVFVLFVLLFIGPLFETLPNCVLSSIILVALKGLFLQVHDLPKLWSSSRLDAAIWLATFVVAVVDLSFGLLVGILVSVGVLLLRAQHTPAANLGHVPLTDLYLDMEKYSKAVEVPGVKIFQFGGPLHFCNAYYFRTKLFSVTGLNLAVLTATTTSSLTQSPSANVAMADSPTTSISTTITMKHHNDTTATTNHHTDTTASITNNKAHDSTTTHHCTADSTTDAQGTTITIPPKDTHATHLNQTPVSLQKTNPHSIQDTSINVSSSELPDESRVTLNKDTTKDFICTKLPVVRCLVLDMSSVTFVDTMGARVLTQLQKELQNADVTLCLAAASDRVLETLERCGTLEDIGHDLTFHSIHDALTVITCDSPKVSSTTITRL